MKKFLILLLALTALFLFASCSTMQKAETPEEIWELTPEEQVLYDASSHDTTVAIANEAFADGIYSAEWNGVIFKRLMGEGKSTRQYLFNNHVGESGNTYSGAIIIHYTEKEDGMIEVNGRSDLIINDTNVEKADFFGISNGEEYLFTSWNGTFNDSAFFYWN